MISENCIAFAIDTPVIQMIMFKNRSVVEFSRINSIVGKRVKRSVWKRIAVGWLKICCVPRKSGFVELWRDREREREIFCRKFRLLGVLILPRSFVVNRTKAANISTLYGLLRRWRPHELSGDKYNIMCVHVSNCCTRQLKI